jgi:hypothetical protein
MKTLITFALLSPLPGRGGWGNGYVAIPKGHPCFGMDYDAIHKKYRSISVNGGLTFADPKITGQPKETVGFWIVGFDTLHFNDTPLKWPDKNSILQEANELKKQLVNIGNRAKKKTYYN